MVSEWEQCGPSDGLLASERTRFVADQEDASNVRKPTNVAITGLGTFLGRRLAERLAATQREFGVIGVDLRRPYGLSARVRFHPVDLTIPTADGHLAEIFSKEEVDTVVHTAFRRAPTPDLEEDHELETIGSLYVLNACAAVGVQRLVVASTTMVYGPRPDNPNFLTESHPLHGHPAAHCVVNRVEMERLVAEWAVGHPRTRVTVLRPCWIMGPNYMDPVVRYFSRPVVPTLLGYDPLLQFVHEEDCLHAFETAVLRNHPGVFNVVGRGVLPLSTILRTGGKRLLQVPAAALYRLRYYPSRAQTGDGPEGFYDYLRYLWVADGERGWVAFGEPEYSTREAWMSFVSSRRMRRYR
jgi:UDP-glucose 4-epimerase